LYGNKKLLTVVSWILIFALVFIPVHRGDAVAPAVAPAMYWAIGSLIVATGVYATTDDGLQYLVNDYWNNASSNIKYMWEQTVLYATTAGYLLINSSLVNDMIDYLTNEKSMTVGENALKEILGEVPIQYDPDIIYNVEDISINGYPVSSKLELVNIDPNEPNIKYQYREVLMCNGVVLYDGTYKWSRPLIQLPTEVKIWGDRLKMNYRRYDPVKNMVLQSHFNIGHDVYFDTIRELLNLVTLDFNKILGDIHDYTADSSGIGTALEPEEELRVPCPPVPEVEWNPDWINDLEKELNRTDNPDIDDETKINEGNHEWDWYVDEHGNIYRVKKGQPPRKPDDEPIRIPGPPLPIPNIPDDYPTEDEPDITTEHHPPQTTVTEHPDGSRTETTTQTTTTTRRWWDPSSQRWRTTITDTTTTTTVDFAPDGTEIGRTTTTDTQPRGETEETPQRDDTAIDWEPLRRGLYELTEKFPFCLPWDLMRGIQSLESNQWDRKIEIDVGDGIWPEMIIDLTIFDEIARIARVVFLIVFDLGLIFATRRLMGGDV
jgi:hypothetical protein